MGWMQEKTSDGITRAAFLSDALKAKGIQINNSQEGEAQFEKKKKKKKLLKKR